MLKGLNSNTTSGSENDENTESNNSLSSGKKTYKNS